MVESDISGRNAFILLGFGYDINGDQVKKYID